MARKKTPAETQVESIRHKDKRTNIPTEELRDFIADDEQAPNIISYSESLNVPNPVFAWRAVRAVC
jgi:adenine-specific DNA-methyltransferase